MMTMLKRVKVNCHQCGEGYAAICRRTFHIENECWSDGAELFFNYFGQFIACPHCRAITDLYAYRIDVKEDADSELEQHLQPELTDFEKTISETELTKDIEQRMRVQAWQRGNDFRREKDTDLHRSTGEIKNMRVLMASFNAHSSHACFALAEIHRELSEFSDAEAYLQKLIARDDALIGGFKNTENPKILDMMGLIKLQSNQVALISAPFPTNSHVETVKRKPRKSTSSVEMTDWEKELVMLDTPEFLRGE